MSDCDHNQKFKNGQCLDCYIKNLEAQLKMRDEAIAGWSSHCAALELALKGLLEVCREHYHNDMKNAHNLANHAISISKLGELFLALLEEHDNLLVGALPVGSKIFEKIEVMRKEVGL